MFRTKKRDRKMRERKMTEDPVKTSSSEAIDDDDYEMYSFARPSKRFKELEEQFSDMCLEERPSKVHRRKHRKMP